MKTKQGVGIIALSLLFSLTGSCKSPSNPTTPPVTKNYNIKVSNMDIFNNAILGGEYILDGKRAASGTELTIKSNRNDGTLALNTIDVDNMPGYKGAYIVLADNSGNIYLTRDAGGHHSGPKLISSDTDLFAKLIPDSFDTQTLAKSIRWNADPPTIGTIANYAKQTIPVAIRNAGQEPTSDDIDNVLKVIKLINDGAGGIIFLNYLGKVDSDLTDGVTCKFYEAYSTHAVNYDNNNKYLILNSKAISRSGVGLSIIAEELVQAATGLVADVPALGFAYLEWDNGLSYYIRDGARAVKLANLLPAGFQLDATSNSPAVLQRYEVPVITRESGNAPNPRQVPYNASPGMRGINVPERDKMIKKDEKGNSRIRN